MNEEIDTLCNESEEWSMAPKQMRFVWLDGQDWKWIANIKPDNTSFLGYMISSTLICT